MFCYKCYSDDVSKDLETINNLIFQWKINFKAHPTKQVYEVIFKRKAKDTYVTKYSRIDQVKFMKDNL